MRLGESPLKFAIGPADGDEVSVSLMILMEPFAVLSAGSFLIWICLCILADAVETTTRIETIRREARRQRAQEPPSL